MGEKVILGLSGGMDSAYVAIKLLEMGYDVTAVNIIMCDDCDGSESSRKLAEGLGIKFDVIDARRDFEELVIKPFVSSYVSGVTPNPCVLCNPTVKIGKLFSYMKSHGADYVATGHYAAPVKCGDRWGFAPAKDVGKDQGYFLYALPQEMFPHLLMPLGSVLKNDIKAFFAEENSVITPPKTESTDICFVSGKSYTDIISAYAPLPPSGNFIDEFGTILGVHKGIHNYTVGQRKGLGIALGKPAYVSRIDPVGNTVTLSTGKALVEGFSVKNVNRVVASRLNDGDRFAVRVRYRARPVGCSLANVNDSKINCVFDEPQPPVASGQSAVFYNEDGIIAFGGTIV